MWSLDDVLRYVPIGALFDGKEYLIQRFRISVFTSASLARLTSPPDHGWKWAGFGVTKPDLPAVEAELNGIGRILEGPKLLDDDFTESALHDTLIAPPPVVHIASHFTLAPGDYSHSFLMLGGGHKLTLDKLQGFRFTGVQLLTLSACETGMGGSGRRTGAEVESFGAAAQKLGAKAVIASLWPVDDRSTSLLMQEFYRIRESSAGVTKAEALQRAQIRLLNGDVKPGPGELSARSTAPTRGASFRPDPNAPYAHPFYWAPFFLIGNWQ